MLRLARHAHRKIGWRGFASPPALDTLTVRPQADGSLRFFIPTEHGDPKTVHLPAWTEASVGEFRNAVTESIGGTVLVEMDGAEVPDAAKLYDLAVAGVFSVHRSSYQDHVHVAYRLSSHEIVEGALGLDHWEIEAIPTIHERLLEVANALDGSDLVLRVSMEEFEEVCAAVARELGPNGITTDRGRPRSWERQSALSQGSKLSPQGLRFIRALESRGVAFRRGWSLDERTRDAVFVSRGKLRAAWAPTLSEAVDINGVRSLATVRERASELMDVTARRSAMEVIWNTTRSSARRFVWRGAIGAGIMSVVQYSTLAYFIYEVSWDVIEPIAALVTASHSAMFFAFFLWARNEPTENGIWNYFLDRRQTKLHQALPDLEHRDLAAFNKDLDALRTRETELRDDVTTLLARARIPFSGELSDATALLLSQVEDMDTATRAALGKK